MPMRSLAGRLFAHRPIRRSIALSFELLFVIPAAALAIALAWRAVDDSRQQLEARMADNAQAVARATEDFLSRHHQSVELLATNLSDGNWDGRRVQNLLDRHMAAFDGLLSALVADRDGVITFVAVADRIRERTPEMDRLIGDSVADRDYFTSVRATGQSFVSDAFEGRGIGNDWLVAMSAPIEAGGAFAGIAEVSLDLSGMAEIWEAHRRIDGEDLAIVDQRGQFVFSTLPAHGDVGWLGAVLAGGGEVGVGEAGIPQADGGRVDHLLASHRLDNGWHAVITLPSSHLHAVVWDEIERVALFLAMVVVVSGIAARVVSRRITEPLEQLKRHVQAFRIASDWQPIDPTSYPPAEVAEVVEGFNEVATRLKSSVTELRQVNAQESRLRHQLEHVVNDREAEIERRTEELKERSDELARAVDAAMAADQAKSEFLANMSHEMRSPLTAVIGFTESILEESDPPPEVAERLEIVLSNSRHLLQLIGDVLDLSKIEAGELELEWQNVALAPMVAEFCAGQRALASARGLYFELDAELPLPRRVRADVTRLRQIMFNLVSNALKFTAAGGVTIRLDYDRDAQMLRCAVRDTGIGIPPESLGRIFERFQQADSSVTRRYGGTGLGLVISRQLAEAMGGTLTVTSQVGEGSTFELSLPVAAGAGAEAWITDAAEFQVQPRAGSRVRTPARRSGRVLVVDDSPHNLKLVSIYLERMGVTAETAANGREAVEAVLADPPDLVLMDMHMPVMGGEEATRRIRAQCPRRVPIVALTADVVADHGSQHRAAGCDDVLAKPIDQARFEEVVLRFLDAAAGGAAPAAPDRRAFVSSLEDRLRTLQAAAARGEAEPLRAGLQELERAAGSHGMKPLVRAATRTLAGLDREDPGDGLAELLADLERQAALAQRALALAG